MMLWVLEQVEMFEGYVLGFYKYTGLKSTNNIFPSLERFADI